MVRRMPEKTLSVTVDAKLPVHVQLDTAKTTALLLLARFSEDKFAGVDMEKHVYDKKTRTRTITYLYRAGRHAPSVTLNKSPFKENGVEKHTPTGTRSDGPRGPYGSRKSILTKKEACDSIPTE